MMFIYLSFLGHRTPKPNHIFFVATKVHIIRSHHLSQQYQHRHPHHRHFFFKRKTEMKMN